MAGKDQLAKQVAKGVIGAVIASSLTKALTDATRKAFVDKAAEGAIKGAAKPFQGKADQRRKNKLRNEDIYRLLNKVRVIGEAALALGDEAQDDERQRMVKESAALRGALHEQLADLRLSSGVQKSEVLDAIHTAIAGADRLVTALNKWALSSPGSGRTSALREAVQALDASQNALLSTLDKTRRRRPRKGENGHVPDDELRPRP